MNGISRFIGGSACAVALLFAAGQVSAQNLIVNPGFELAVRTLRSRQTGLPTPQRAGPCMASGRTTIRTLGRSTMKSTWPVLVQGLWFSSTNPGQV